MEPEVLVRCGSIDLCPFMPALCLPLVPSIQRERRLILIFVPYGIKHELCQQVLCG